MLNRPGSASASALGRHVCDVAAALSLEVGVALLQCDVYRRIWAVACTLRLQLPALLSQALHAVVRHPSLNAASSKPILVAGNFGVFNLCSTLKSAEAFTASYVRDEAEKRGSIRDNDLANVFVTRYQQSDGVLRETVKFARRLAKENGYQVEEQKIEGVRVFRITGNGETWALWAAKRYVVKVGGRGRDSIPGDLVEAYGDRFGSRLAGGMLEGPLPPGPEPKKTEGSDAEPYDENNPKPDWETYDPKKPSPNVTTPKETPVPETPRPNR
jgi:hypothetical protein